MSNIKDNDRQILYECINLKVYDSLVQVYWKRLFHIIRKILVYYRVDYDYDVIEEIRSLFMIEILKNDCKKLQQYDEKKGQGLRLWIIMICRQYVLNYLRDKKLLSITTRKNIKSIEEEDYIETQNLFDEYSVKEDEFIINKCLSTFKAEDQLIIKLFYYDGYTLNEIASMLNKNIVTVNTKKFRLLRKLKKCLRSLRAL